MQKELPLGFGMALAQNPEAMKRFAEMPEERQAQVVSGTHGIQSRAEMHAYVEQLAHPQ